jgi:peptidyl-prolyl cis-trans isomerase B (cyclophilin B)
VTNIKISPLNRYIIFFFLFFSLTWTQLFAQDKVLIKTTEGNIIVKLYEETPQHRNSFLGLVAKSYYDSTIFHRVIKGFMIQGGDPESRNASGQKVFSNGGPGYTIPAEIDEQFIHKKGALAAARQPDQYNSSKRSNGSQFYIVQGRKYPREYLPKIKNDKKVDYTEEQKKIYETIGGSPHLDGGYTIFGEVIGGLDVVDRIAGVETNGKDRPKRDIRIIRMIVLND